MVIRFSLFLTLLLATTRLFSNEILIVEGKYQGKNIYILNSFNSNGVGFCIYEVYVNGVRTTDEINSLAFEVDLRTFSFSEQAKVEIKILHKNDCKPKVLNPEDLQPRPTFETKSILISSTGLMTWVTTKESGALPYIIEQYRWNKWVYIGEIEGFGTSGEHSYSFQVTAHSGLNKFRVKQSGLGQSVKYSPEVQYTDPSKALLTYSQSNNSKKISISQPSLFEMYDEYARVVLKGYGTKIDLNTFANGTYWFCFDNQVVKIKK